MSQPHKIRIGAVSYLNTRPLVFRFDDFCRDAELVYDFPSRLADRLQAGELDVALIPTLELFRGENYTVVSDACIGCHGPVMSVKLLSRTPISDIKRLALDEGSRTSVALVQILLTERANIRPELEPLPLGKGVESTTADAVLLIGDRAMQVDEGEFKEVWDLGDQWCRWAELPFVFALWVAREDANLTALSSTLSAVRDAGVRNLETIARQCGPEAGLHPQRALIYLRDYLYFYLGPRENRG